MMTNDNQALWRSVHFLSRPYSWVALLLLLVNDSFLRHFWPSAVTGKLSDLAWMFLAPVVFIAGAALAAPKGLRRHERIVAGAGFGLTAAGFALFKTLPFIRDMVLAVWQAGLGFPAAAVIDPTDLAALVSVIFAAWLWLRQPAHASPLPLRAVFVIPLLGLLTLADAAAPDYGIACLENRDGKIMAFSSYNTFSTSDGGLTWNEEKSEGYVCDMMEPSAAEFTLEPAGPHFRFQPGESIESSSDGIHWEVAYSLVPLTEANKAYYQKVQNGNPGMREAPLAGLADAQHASVIFAMGHEGLLVRPSSGVWTWVAVGSYRRVEAASAWSFMTTVLNGEIVLAAALIFLVLSLGATIRRRPLILTLLIWAGWLGWGLLPMIFAPALSTQYMASLTIIGAYGIAVLAFVTGVIGSVLLLRVSKGTFLRVFGVALIGGLLYILPYGLWAFNLMPQYYLTESLALVLGIGAGAAGYYLVRNRAETIQK